MLALPAVTHCRTPQALQTQAEGAARADFILLETPACLLDLLRCTPLQIPGAAVARAVITVQETRA